MEALMCMSSMSACIHQLSASSVHRYQHISSMREYLPAFTPAFCSIGLFNFPYLAVFEASWRWAVGDVRGGGGGHALGHSKLGDRKVPLSFNSVISVVSDRLSRLHLDPLKLMPFLVALVKLAAVGPSNAAVNQQ